MRLERYTLLSSILFVTLFVSRISFAQRQAIDSLIKVNQAYTEVDTFKVEILDKLGFAYRFFGPDSVLYYADKVKEISEQLNYKRGIAASYKLRSMGLYMRGDVPNAILYTNKALDLYTAIGELKGEASMLNNLGMFYYEKGEHRTSVDYYLRSLELRQLLGHQPEIADSYNNLGNAFNSLGDYAQALSFHFKALSIREKLNKAEDLADSYTNISSVYYMIHSYEESLVYAKKAYLIFKQYGQSDGILNSLLNFGSIYTELGPKSKALHYFKEALVLNKQLKLEVNLAIVYYNIGHIYLNLKNYSLAKCYLDSALNTTSKSYYNEGAALTYIDLGFIARAKGQLKEAEILLRKGLEIAEVIGSKPRQSEASKELAKLMQVKGDLKQANHYLELAMMIDDSLHKAEINKGIYQSKLDYLLENHKQKIDLLEKDKSLQSANLKFQRLLLTSLIVALLLLGGIIFIQRRNVLRMRQVQSLIMEQSDELKSQADNLQEVNRVKDKVFSVLSHDLRGPINSLTSVMSMMNSDLMTADEFNQMRDKFSQQLRSLNLMLDNLLFWSRANLKGIIDTNKSYVNVNKKVQQTFLLLGEVARGKQIRLQSDLTIDSVVYADADHMDIIFRNLISNALKYTPNGGSITITEQVNGNMREINVTDTGVGMSEEKMNELFTDLPIHSQYGTKGEKGTGIGLLITREFVMINKGTIKVESKLNEGTTFTVSFPIEQN